MTEGSVIILLVVAFGACVGSFLNVCIYRLPRRESLLWPGSRCTSCGRALTWYDNIPLLSWVTLGGRCRTCKASVSSMYPIVEAVTALAFLGGYLLYGLTLLALVRILFACALIVLGLLRRRTSELWLIPAFAIYGLSLVYAWAALSLGH